MNDSLGDRMKANYETRARHYLTRRMPVIVRVDGRAFHTYTKGCLKPFDNRIMDGMILAAYHVYAEMQGVKMAYIQSDEASFVLTDYDDLNTEAWFGYCQNKIESITAALMSAAFGQVMQVADQQLANQQLAVFDARAFNIPESEVANYFLWRAKDWHRNSVQMLAQAHYSHAQLQNHSVRDLQVRARVIGHDWDDLLPDEKYGTFIVGTGGLMREYYVEDRYVEIAKLWESVRPKDTPSATSRDTSNEPKVRGKRSGASKDGRATSPSGCYRVGTPRKKPATRRPKT